MKKAQMLICLLALGFIYATLPAPTNTQISELVKKLNAIEAAETNNAEKLEQSEQVVNEAAQQFDFAKLSFEQAENIVSTCPGGIAIPLGKRMIPALERLMKIKTKKGAQAAVLNAVVSIKISKEDNEDEALAEAFKQAVRHPGIDSLLRTDASIFASVRYNVKPAIANKSGLIAAMLPLINKRMESPVTPQLVVIFYEMVADPEAGQSLQTIERIRLKCLDIEKRWIGKGAAPAYAGEAVEFLEGPAAKQQLIGHTAPAVPFNWISKNGTAKSLADLTGKVVLIDFWATWCVPCVKSFPYIRKLQERYKDYPVEIIGVTSIQGFHMDWRNNQGKINTEGDTGKEYALMDTFMRDMDITWKIAFSSQSCFNPDFGVRGIPHMAIIDPAGKVVFNGHSSKEGSYSEPARIDSLLNAFSLPYPKQSFVPTEKINQSVSH